MVYFLLSLRNRVGDTDGRRPGDVTLPVWSAGCGLAIDVAVTSPLLKGSVRLFNPCEEYAATQKHGKYDKGFEGVHYSFAAMVWETLGAINVEGEEVLRQIFSFAAKKLHREFSSFCGRAWAQFSCCLQRSVSQAILLRIGGQEFRQKPPKPVGLAGTKLVRASVPEPLSPPALPLLSSSCVSAPSAPLSLVAASLSCSQPQESDTTPVLSHVSGAQAPVPVVACGLVDVSDVTPPPAGSGGVFAIRGDSFCGYHCVGALGVLFQDPRALDSGFECSYDVLAVTRKRIFDAYSEWWVAKRVFYTTDAEMEVAEVAAHVESSQAFRDRVSGRKEGGLLAWACDLALYALKTDVLIVLVDAQRITPSTSSKWDEDKGCEELWFDPVVETKKKRLLFLCDGV